MTHILSKSISVYWICFIYAYVSVSCFRFKWIPEGRRHSVSLDTCLGYFKGTMNVPGLTDPTLHEIINMDSLYAKIQQIPRTSHVWFVNSLALGKFEWNFRYVIFQGILVIEDWGISCEIALIWWSVNIGSGNGLMPSCKKPLTEPTLIQISDVIWRH